MIINAIQCNQCKDIIFSRTRHDFRWCSCQSTAIDGGFDYVKITGNNWKKLKIDIDTTNSILYDDWNNNQNQFGLIKYNSKEAVKICQLLKTE